MPAECPRPYPVAMIPYVNMLPYRAMGTPPHCCWHDYVPRDSVAALAAGKVMAAAVPVGALPALADCVEPLGQYGIAARESSMSVLFFSVRPFEQIRIDDRMQLTPDSATSVRLLYLLLKCRQTTCVERSNTSHGDAVGELIIGDQAIERMHALHQASGRNGAAKRMTESYPYVTDLATCWYANCGRPFVFARWVIRRDAPSEARAILMDWLDDFKQREDALICRSIPLAARRFGLPGAWFEEYYQCLRRVLRAEDLEGQALFLKEICRTRIDRDVLPEATGENGAPSSQPTDLGRPLPVGHPMAPYMEAGAGPWQPRVHPKEAS